MTSLGLDTDEEHGVKHKAKMLVEIDKHKDCIAGHANYPPMIWTKLGEILHSEYALRGSYVVHEHDGQV